MPQKGYSFNSNFLNYSYEIHSHHRNLAHQTRVTLKIPHKLFK